MQRDGQEIELQHFVDQVIKLMADPPIGAGLTREQAIEQVQISLGKASKNIDAKSFSVDPATTQMIAKIIERINETEMDHRRNRNASVWSNARSFLLS